MKYKYMLFGSLITLIVIFVASVMMININVAEKITIKEVDKYSEKITVLKNKIKKMEDGTCKGSLTKMLNRINNTNFQGKVSIEEYYKGYFKDDESFMSIFDNVIKQCEIEYNDELYMDVLNQSIYPDEIKMRYLLSYELTLKDFFSREYINYQTSEKATFITKTLELNILRQLIEEVQNEKDL